MFCFSCVTLISVIMSLIVLSYLAFVIVYVPVYRYVAITLLVLLLMYKMSVWRLLPTERAHMRMLAQKIVEQRRAYGAMMTEPINMATGGALAYIPASPYV
uniref:Uncharacterized protein n=1 Tax=Trypanosoma congolense (strain IL3000) TaxID=1068625 RepID=G0UMK5_TRYCI|nr:hypothetical protein, unlikely [Trypanosoma congolense IL3000]